MGVELTLHREFSRALKDQWDALLAESAANVPFLRFAYLEQWWKGRGGGEWPQESQLTIITADQDGKLIGIAPLFTAPNKEGEPVLFLLGSVEISDYLDFIIRPADLPAFVDALLPFLRANDLPGKLDLNNLFDDSPSLAVLGDWASVNGGALTVEPLQRCPTIHLPGDWEQYLAAIDKKQRHEIRRKMRRAAEMQPSAEWYLVEDPSSLDTEIDAFFALMAEDEEKKTFLTRAMQDTMRALLHEAQSAGLLKLAFLGVEGEKAAAYILFDYAGKLWVYNSGFSRKFMSYSPGWVLLGHLLQWANEGGYSEFDFMRGDEEYKYRFGAVDRHIVRAMLKY